VADRALFCRPRGVHASGVHGNDRVEWFLRVGRDYLGGRDKNTVPRAKLTMKAGDIAAMPADIRHQAIRPNARLLVWKTRHPTCPSATSARLKPIESTYSGNASDRERVTTPSMAARARWSFERRRLFASLAPLGLSARIDRYGLRSRARSAWQVGVAFSQPQHRAFGRIALMRYQRAWRDVARLHSELGPRRTRILVGDLPGNLSTAAGTTRPSLP